MFGLIVGTLLGACVGSFVAALARRAPEDWRGAMTGRSACPACGSALRPIELVPVLSWLGLRGRCARCGVRISPYYPAVEVAAAAIGAIGVALRSPETALLGWWLLALALIDLRTGLLPDRLTWPLVILGLVFHRPLEDALLGAAVGYGGTWLLRFGYARLRRREGLGLGDVKLMAAAGAWLGPLGLATVLWLGALLTLAAVMILHRGPRGDTAVPFGPGLAAAAWVTALAQLAPG